jgi:hypothetical protein
MPIAKVATVDRSVLEKAFENSVGALEARSGVLKRLDGLPPSTRQIGHRHEPTFAIGGQDSSSDQSGRYFRGLRHGTFSYSKDADFLDGAS